MTWTIEDAREQYGIRAWGDGHFDLDGDGRVRVTLAEDSAQSATLEAIVAAAQDEGLRLPMLVRFPQIIEQRIDRLVAAFDEAIAAADYDGDYTPVFPIKVNQQRSVVEVFARHEAVGLEAGSKPELIAVLAHARAGSKVICNGYKDREYIRLALLGRRLGLDVYLVVEKPAELQLVLEEAERLQVAPLLGVRVRLAAAGGKWRDSGGERAKFGLSASQLVQLISTLDDAGALDRLQLLHFHMGSQISNVRDIHRAMREAGRYLVEMRRLGVSIDVLDVGGGLAVDYEGARSRGDCSMNYSVQQYAGAVVGTLADLCRANDIPQPDIVSESGRALVAHHAVLLADVVATERIAPDPPRPDDDEPPVLHGLRRVLDALDEAPPQETWLEASHFHEEGQQQFVYGELSLAHRALLEQRYQAALLAVRARLDPDRRAHRELLDPLNASLADKLFVNLSIFQSLPDVWAIDQVFPILPIAGHDRPPGRRAVLEDLTCDSDGRIDRFVEHGAIESTLPLPDLGDDGEEGDRVLGAFLVGAYQETLGDLHNLFGDTDSVVVWLDRDGPVLRLPRRGESAADLLEQVGYPRARLEALIRDKVEASGLSPRLAEELERDLAHSLDSYTYLAVSER